MIALSNIHKTYRTDGADNHVLRGVDLSIEAGDFVALMGSSGSGKTTLLNIIGALDQDYQGDATIAGQDPRTLGDKALSHFRNRSVSFIFQQFHLLNHLPVLDNVMMPSWFASDARDKRPELAKEVLAKVGLAHKAGSRPNHLSGGEKQRVAIARAIFNRPKILLCDEPTGALDSATSDTVFHLIEDLNRTLGLTIVVVTHEPDIAARCRRTVRIVDGQVASDTASASAGAPGDTSRGDA